MLDVRTGKSRVKLNAQGRGQRARSLVGLVALVALGILAGCRKDKPATTHETTSAELAAGDAATVRIRPVQGDLRQLLAAEAKRAKARNLRPYVELRADWCSPCQAIAKSRADAAMKDAFTGTYVVEVDIDDWADQLESVKLDASAIPAFVALDDAGRPTSRRIDGSAWGDDTTENMAPPLKAFFLSR